MNEVDDMNIKQKIIHEASFDPKQTGQKLVKKKQRDEQLKK